MENYQFIKQIGQGHFSEVWLVKCARSKKKYVLKRIDLHNLLKREQRAAHLEAKLLSTVKHPYIVTYLDSFYNSKGSLFLIMCYCECGDLYTYLKSQNGVHFEEKQVSHWFVQICMALKYLHDKKIFHRDLKTKNIFLTRSKLIKVGNFGISRAITKFPKMASTLIGTPIYMSPELLCGQDYNEKSDVWALGCCIYEIAMLNHVVDSQCVQDLKKIIKGKLNLIAEIYSTELYVIISSMLSYEQENRPSVTELLLNEYLRKHIVLSLQDTPRSGSVISNSSKSDSVTSQDIKHGYHLLPDINKEIDIGEKDNMKRLQNESVITIPDVNGNGDGNDNSQQRANLSLVASTDSNDPMIKRNASDNSNFVICGFFEDNLNPSTKRCNIFQASSFDTSTREKIEKIRSNFSFQILNNLTYSIKSTRFMHWDFFSNVSNNESTKPKYFYGTDPPKSAEEFFTRSISTNYKTKSQSAVNTNRCFKNFSKNDEGNSLALPHIFKNELKTPSCESLENKVGLPLLYDLKLHTKKPQETSVKVFQKEDSKDSSVDNLLLQKIMDCNKVTKDI